MRAGPAASARDYPWPGHGALSAQDASVLDVHDLELELGRCAEAQCRAYRTIIQSSVAPSGAGLANWTAKPLAAFFVTARSASQDVSTKAA